MKINKREKLTGNLMINKNMCCTLEIQRDTLDHGLNIGKVHRLITFNQKEWSKTHIDLNTKFRRIQEIKYKKLF